LSAAESSSVDAAFRRSFLLAGQAQFQQTHAKLW
jgi:hypothetical protein